MGQNLPDERMITLHKLVCVDESAALLLVLAGIANVVAERLWLVRAIQIREEGVADRVIVGH